MTQRFASTLGFSPAGPHRASKTVSPAPQPVDLLVLGPTLVTMDSHRSVVAGGALAIRDGRIVWMGAVADAAGRFAPADTLHAPDRIALPGLLDTHVHTGQQLLRGKIAELGRRRQLRMAIWRNYLIPFESVLEPEDVYLSGLLAYANMLRVGTTCFADAGGPHPDEMGRAAEEVGIRGVIALSTADMGEDLPPGMRSSTREAIAQNTALVTRWSGRSGSGRVTAWLALRQLIVCSQELWEAFRDLADELGVRVHTHLAEGTHEVDYAAERWGKRPAEHLDSIGFLGPRMHAAHAVLLADAEIELLAQRGVTVAHCPVGNFIVGPPRVPEMLRRGIAVGIGSDGAANGSLDLFRALQVSLVALQSHFGTPWHVRSVIGPEDLLAVATNGGARAMGMGDELGALEVGRQADLLLVDPESLDLQPVYESLWTAARGVTGANIETVIVAGRIVMKERELQTVDERAMRARVEKRWPAIMARFEQLVN
jgi:5-methylthioadenosine/S-adenosylhomocysteine deaminase